MFRRAMANERDQGVNGRKVDAATKQLATAVDGAQRGPISRLVAPCADGPFLCGIKGLQAKSMEAYEDCCGTDE